MRKYLALLLLFALALLVGCDDASNITGPDKAPAAETDNAVSALGATSFSLMNQAGTTLSAEKTATGFFERRIEYDWTVEKTADVSSIEVQTGASGVITYTINATRSVASTTDTHGVRGQVCVTNGGDRATQDLQIIDQVEYKLPGPGKFQDLAGASQTINPAELGPGERACYDYEITFTPVAGALYRNVAHVTITNHSGWLPGGQTCPGPDVCPFGPDPKEDFLLPADPTITEIDAEADAIDLGINACPPGFDCISAAGSIHFTGTGSEELTTELFNVSAACDENFTLTNTITLTESDTEQERTDAATVNLFTGACPQTCQRTIGYWKTHAGFTGRNADRVTQHLPIWLGTASGAKSVQVTNATQAVGLLSMSGDASNGINKLYAQLLAAKLNLANGALATPALTAAIAAADVFLANNDASNWAGLSRAQKQTVLGWATALDVYNNSGTCH